MTSAKILIVDQDPLLGEQLRALIGVLGHQACCLTDSTRALQKIEEGTFDAVFCDYWLPPQGGQAFYQQVAYLRPDLAPRVIFLVGGILGEETQFFIRNAGNRQLVKPFKLTAVQRVLQQICEPTPAVPD